MSDLDHVMIYLISTRQLSCSLRCSKVLPDLVWLRSLSRDVFQGKPLNRTVRQYNGKGASHRRAYNVRSVCMWERSPLFIVIPVVLGIGLKNLFINTVMTTSTPYARLTVPGLAGGSILSCSHCGFCAVSPLSVTIIT